MANNTVTDKNRWFISYLPNSRANVALTVFDAFADHISTADETAIKHHDKDGYLILDGDWQEEYSKCETWEDALKVYSDNREDHKNFWSEEYRHGFGDTKNESA